MEFVSGSGITRVDMAAWAVLLLTRVSGLLCMLLFSVMRGATHLEGE